MIQAFVNLFTVRCHAPYNGVIFPYIFFFHSAAIVYAFLNMELTLKVFDLFYFIIKIITGAIYFVKDLFIGIIKIIIRAIYFVKDFFTKEAKPSSPVGRSANRIG